MATFKIGSHVQMSSAFKAALINNGCNDHVSEFGDKIGHVCEIELDIATVAWQVKPKPLKYHYKLSSLEPVDI